MHRQLRIILILDTVCRPNGPMESALLSSLLGPVIIVDVMIPSWPDDGLSPWSHRPLHLVRLFHQQRHQEHRLPRQAHHISPSTSSRLPAESRSTSSDAFWTKLEHFRRLTTPHRPNSHTCLSQRDSSKRDPSTNNPQPHLLNKSQSKFTSPADYGPRVRVFSSVRHWVNRPPYDPTRVTTVRPIVNRPPTPVSPHRTSKPITSHPTPYRHRISSSSYAPTSGHNACSLPSTDPYSRHPSERTCQHRALASRRKSSHARPAPASAATSTFGPAATARLRTPRLDTSSQRASPRNFSPQAPGKFALGPPTSTSTLKYTATSSC